MTTNVFDQPGQVLATDSRWSIQCGKWLLYVDDAQFDKIELYKSTAFMFAGCGRGVQSWKNWIRSEPTDDSNMPPVERIAVCVIETTSGTVKFAEKQEIVRDGGYFAGSGARHAYVCWNENRDALRCIDTAKSIDPCTGGETKYVKCAGTAHNLSYPTVDTTIEMVNQAVNERGMVMELAKSGGAPFKLKDVAANDTSLRDAQAKIAAGELSVEAPCDQMYNTWSDQEKSQLKNVLSGVFGWAK